MKKYRTDAWGSSGEEMTDVWSRQMDTIAEYVDLMLKEKLDKGERS